MAEVIMVDGEGNAYHKHPEEQQIPADVPMQVRMAFNYVNMCCAIKYQMVPELAGGARLDERELDSRLDQVLTLSLHCIGQYVSTGIAEREEEAARRFEALAGKLGYAKVKNSEA